MTISLPQRLSFLLCLPAVAVADVNVPKRERQAKAGKVDLPETTFGRISTETTTSCATAATAIYESGYFAACSRYWYGSGGQDSTCPGNPYVDNSSGNFPANGNPGANTCLGAGDTPSCFVLEGFNNNEPVLVRTSVAWDWSNYAVPSTFPTSGVCGTALVIDPNSVVNTCADILTDSSISLVGADTPSATSTGAGGQTDQTTGQCYNVLTPLTPYANPGVVTITSTVTFTIDSNDYECQVTAGGKVCEMWGYTNGYGNNFDSQYVPFHCDDIGGDEYEGYIAFVFDHRLLTPVTDGIGQAPQLVLRKV